MILRNIRLIIAYDGSSYCGWQRQKNAPTIQGEIEKSIAIMIDSDVSLHGAGRTDSGVHAIGMTANFKTTSSIPCSGFVQGLNALLPEDIRILAADSFPMEFHSRYNATGKSYRYDIFTGSIQLPTERLYAVHLPVRLDNKSIETCLQHVTGSHDFSSFEGSGSRDISLQTGRGATRTLFKACFVPHDRRQDRWSFYFTGDGFLRHMVRNLVGTLLEVGAGKTSAKEFLAIMHARNRSLAGPTAPARGLFLEKVLYDPIKL